MFEFLRFKSISEINGKKLIAKAEVIVAKKSVYKSGLLILMFRLLILVEIKTFSR